MICVIEINLDNFCLVLIFVCQPWKVVCFGEPGFLPQGGRGAQPLRQFAPIRDFCLLKFGPKTIEKLA